MALLREPPAASVLAARRCPSAYHGGRDLLLEAKINHCLEAGDPVLRLYNPGPEGVARLAERFSGKCHWHILAIEVDVSFDSLAKPIGDRGATSLRAVLRACPSLQRLRLHCNNIGDGGVRALCGAVEDCVSLRMLDVTGNRISSDGARLLHLTCHARGGLHLKGVAVPHDSIAMWLAARDPDLEMHGFGDTDVQWLAERFAAAGAAHLEAVSLEGRPHRSLSASGAAALLEVLRACGQLRVLRLSGHALTAEGVNKLGDAIVQFPLLHTLDLRNNNLGADGEGSATALALLLRQCPSLRTLDVTSNGLDKSGDVAERLLEPLRDAPCLESLAGVDLGQATSTARVLGQSDSAEG